MIRWSVKSWTFFVQHLYQFLFLCYANLLRISCTINYYYHFGYMQQLPFASFSRYSGYILQVWWTKSLIAYVNFFSQFCMPKIIKIGLFLSGGVLMWLSVWSKVLTCIWPSWCHCHSLSLASVKSRLLLPFWYRLTWVVPEKEPLNGCVCVCVWFIFDWIIKK